MKRFTQIKKAGTAALGRAVPAKKNCPLPAVPQAVQKVCLENVLEFETSAPEMESPHSDKPCGKCSRPGCLSVPAASAGMRRAQ